MNSEHEHPEVVEEIGAGLLDNGKESAHDRYAEDDTKKLAFDHVGNPEFYRQLIEAELLLQHKVLVVCKRQAENGVDQVEREEKQQRVADFSRNEGRGESSKPDTTYSPDLGVPVVLNRCERLELTEEGGDEAELGFGAAVSLALVEGFLIDLIFESFGCYSTLVDTKLTVKEPVLE